MLKRFVMSICALMAIFCCSAPLPGLGTMESYASSPGFTLKLPTQDEIRAKYKEYNIDLNKAVTYTKDYSASAPYAMGDISDWDRINGLNALNFCRYIAGLPYDVELKSEYNEYTQAASLVNAANNVLTHSPSKPAGMSDALYKMGADGAGSSNLSMGRTNIASCIIKGYMDDSDTSNIDRLGHRRWILNPDMKYTGFGLAGVYSATYAFDRSRSGSFTGDYVAWPPANMPYELYNSNPSRSAYAFSVTLGSAYDTPSISNVTVDIRSAKLNKSWHLDKNCKDYSNYLNVENSYYGNPKCIIFNVDKFPVGDKITVTINGITKGGASAPITYTVNLFELKHKFSGAVTKEPTCISEGIRTYTCACGESYTEAIAKTAHSYSVNWVTDKTATCAEEGLRSHHCTVCGDRKDITAIPKTDHKFLSKVTTLATCTESGVETLTCSVCDTTKTQSIPPTGHSFGEYKITIQPTTDNEGVEESICSGCGATQQRAVEKLIVPESSSGSSSSTDEIPEESSFSSDNEGNNSSDNSGESSSSDSSDGSNSSDSGESGSSDESSSSVISSAAPEDSNNSENEPSDSKSNSAAVDDGKEGFPTALAAAIGACALLLFVVIFLVILSKRKKK